MLGMIGFCIFPIGLALGLYGILKSMQNTQLAGITIVIMGLILILIESNTDEED